MIRDGAQRTVQRASAGEYQSKLDIGPPYEFEVQMRKPVGEAMTGNLAALEGFEIVDDHLIRVVAPDMDIGFRRVAYLGYADQAGVTRH
jgi:hypothetical protein